MFSPQKKILLIGDMPGWAFDNIISFVRGKIEGDYDIYYDFTVYNPRESSVSLSDCNGKADSNLIEKHYRKKYYFSAIPFFNRIAYKMITMLNKLGILERDGEGKKRRTRNDNTYDCIVFLDFYMDIDGNFDHLKAKKIVKGIYTDGFPPRGIVIHENSISSFLNQYFHNADALLAGSSSIADLYLSHSDIAIFSANMAYNELIFKPRKKKETKFDSKLILGWTGNPNREFKGFYELIVPVVKELQEEGLDIELKSQFSGTLNSLADFWQNIDLAIIMSEADAGPSLFMEASLCGVPSISTNIGMPSEVIKDGYNGILIERTELALKSAIKKVYFERETLHIYSSNIRDSYLQRLGSTVQENNWKNLFRNILDD